MDINTIIKDVENIDFSNWDIMDNNHVCIIKEHDTIFNYIRITKTEQKLGFIDKIFGKTPIIKYDSYIVIDNTITILKKEYNDIDEIKKDSIEVAKQFLYGEFVRKELNG